ncbi:hypothetical protein COLO4_35402 [Corchorus olitorius]|uniref:Uncharacterized protein n=1 Tax=Corchorus olitorius TaxID=93759 RepID=A0A1R3GH38_9ROSI|nr:hypothetical protein COLO4_35402 [Corchorus olitorius]
MIFDIGSTQSNLDCFLHCTTPTVKSQFLPKSEIRNLNRLWHPWEREKVEFFTLADLWNCYDEWSAYGAGVPIVLNNAETLVQYYVPYLSAIQIFTRKKQNQVMARGILSVIHAVMRARVKSYGDGMDALLRMEGPSKTAFGMLMIGWINGLARRYPGLMSLRSVDLSPASWMAVAWYPIYHIPMGRTIKDLSTCFLTYHTLSSSFQDMEPEDEMDESAAERKKGKEGEGISLPPFGLATYKMQGNVWVSGNCGRDQERLVSLLSVADSWLKQLRVQHHDFNYFTGIRRG